MSLMDDLDSAVRHHGPVGCIERAVTDHPELRADILEALASQYSSRVVARVFRDRGIQISDYTVQRHRRRDCRCTEELHQ